VIEGSGDNSKWNKTALLHAILKSEPSTPEMELIFHSTLNFKSEVSLQMAIAELEAIRNINERYSRVQFMPGPELMLLVKNGLQRDRKANTLAIDLQARLNSADNKHTLYVWNETGVEMNETYPQDSRWVGTLNGGTNA